MARSEKNYRRSYRNYLIKRRFQLKWTVTILAVATGVFATLGSYIYWMEQTASEQIINGLNQMGYAPEEIALMGELMTESDSSTMWILLGLGVALTGALAGLGVLLTHRVAGPVYALGLFMDQVRDGSYKQVRGFRKGDEFQELADGFQAMLASLREKEEREIERLEAIRSTPDMPQEAVTLVAELAGAKQRYIG